MTWLQWMLTAGVLAVLVVVAVFVMSLRAGALADDLDLPPRGQLGDPDVWLIHVPPMPDPETTTRVHVDLTPDAVRRLWIEVAHLYPPACGARGACVCHSTRCGGADGWHCCTTCPTREDNS